MNHIIYQAYNSIDNLNECLYSLYSLYEFDNNYKVTIYTDNDNYLKGKTPPLDIKYRIITQKEIKNWRGKYNFVHRLKIMIIIDLLDNLSKNDNVLYVDTDTMFINNLDDIFKEIDNNNLFMHINEGRISDKTNIIFNPTCKFRSNFNKIRDFPDL